MASVQDGDGIVPEDWPMENLSRTSSLLHGRGMIPDQGLNTGVRVMGVYLRFLLPAIHVHCDDRV